MSERYAIIVLVLASSSTMADVEIHRCPLDDGTFAFQETPCPEPDANVDDGSEADESTDEIQPPADDAFDFVNPFDEPAEAPSAAEPALPEPVSEDRAECEKLTRDAIDVIDLEMRETAYSKEEGQEYLAELLELTRQLRACKQL